MEGVVGAQGGGAVGAGGVPVVAPGAGGPGVLGGQLRKATQCTCGKEGKHYTETALEVVIPGTPEKIHNLIFASGFIKDFMVGNQKLLGMFLFLVLCPFVFLDFLELASLLHFIVLTSFFLPDVQMSDWAPVNPGSKLLTRNMSYIKPLNGSLGPKQTKCEIKDETVHCDFEAYISTVTTTRTPEVPSGGVFAVKTRTCITWAGPISSKVVVTTQVEWSGRSFIKGAFVCVLRFGFVFVFIFGSWLWVGPAGVYSLLFGSLMRCMSFSRSFSSKTLEFIIRHSCDV